MRRKSLARQQVLPQRHHQGSVTKAFADKLAVAMGRHPAGTGEMGVMDPPGTLGVSVWIEAEENMDGLAPSGAVRGSVEQAQIELHVLAIISREHRALWRLI
jgi:hypothetical protein